MLNYSNVNIYINRFLESDVIKLINEVDVVFIEGGCGCGKSVVLRNLEDFFSNSFFIDFEDFLRGQRGKVNFCCIIPKHVEVVLVDNFYPNEYFLNMVDECVNKRKIKFVISLKKYSHVIGLKSSFKKLFLLPLSFAEHLKNRNELLYRRIYSKIKENYNNFLLGKRRNLSLNLDGADEVYSVFDEFLCYGGYPKVVFSVGIDEKLNALDNVVKNILYDVFGVLNGKFELEFLRNVLVYLAHRCGNFFKITDFMDEFGLSFYKAKSVINAFCLTRSIVLIHPFWDKYNSEYSKIFKVFFLDNGVRNCVINNYDNWRNRGDRNVMFSIFFVSQKVRNGEELYYWKTKMGAYVDFIKWIDNRLVAFSVQNNARKSRVGKGVLSFYKKYHPFRMFVLNYDFLGKYVNNKGYDIIFFPIAFI